MSKHIREVEQDLEKTIKLTCKKEINSQMVRFQSIIDQGNDSFTKENDEDEDDCK